METNGTEAERQARTSTFQRVSTSENPEVRPTLREPSKISSARDGTASIARVPRTHRMDMKQANIHCSQLQFRIDFDF